MLSIRVAIEGQPAQQIDHSAGALEFGRGPQREAQRCIVADESVSRDHLQIEELPNGQVRICNLSRSQDVKLRGGDSIPIAASRELQFPLRLLIGKTVIDIHPGVTDIVTSDKPGEPAIGASPEPGGADTLADTKPVGADNLVRPEDNEAFDKAAYLTIAQPIRPASRSQSPLWTALGDAPAPEKIAHWLETVVALPRSSTGSKEFYEQTARAVVELVGLELGMVLLRRQEKWEIVGYHAVNSHVNSRFSRTLLKHVVDERRTFFQDLDNVKIQSQSLANVEAVVVSPIFGLADDVVGVIYGSRTTGGLGHGKIRPMEAQVVQLLAAAVGDNLARAVATKTRVQFEQFFSAELVRELERDPTLLEGRSQEVTVLVSDLRGFTSLSERLGPETTCRVVRDIMEHLSDRIMAHGGVIVDYAGDGILAMWNAPVPQEDHVPRACRAALAMVRELPGLNAQWTETVGTPLAMGVGLNTGTAQVGNTGSSRKLKYGPHGLTVNLASRVQDATKKVGVPVLISSAVQERLPAGFTTHAVGAIQLAGIKDPVTLYELQDGPPA
jgi:adenylate cyclase